MIHQQKEQQKSAAEKRKQLKKRLKIEKSRRKNAELALMRERCITTDTITKIRLQTKLDDLAFYQEQEA